MAWLWRFFPFGRADGGVVGVEEPPGGGSVAAVRVGEPCRRRRPTAAMTPRRGAAPRRAREGCAHPRRSLADRSGARTEPRSSSGTFLPTSTTSPSRSRGGRRVWSRRCAIRDRGRRRTPDTHSHGRRRCLPPPPPPSASGAIALLIAGGSSASAIRRAASSTRGPPPRPVELRTRHHPPASSARSVTVASPRWPGRRLLGRIRTRRRRRRSEGAARRPPRSTGRRHGSRSRASARCSPPPARSDRRRPARPRRAPRRARRSPPRTSRSPSRSAPGTSRSPASSPSRSSATGRSSNSRFRRRSIAERSSSASSPISWASTRSGRSSRSCRRMSTALITWIGSSWMSAAILRRSSSWAVSISCASSRRCATMRRTSSRLDAELLLGVLLSGDVRPSRLASRRPCHPPRFTGTASSRIHTSRPAFDEEPILGQEPLGPGVRPAMLSDHPLPILRVDRADPELGVLHPFPDAVAEELHDLRARVEVGRELVRPVDVQDRGRSLHELSGRRPDAAPAAATPVMRVTPSR